MLSQYFDPKTFNAFENPVQKLMVLNVKTFQSISYIKPEQLTKLKSPEEILEKNLDVFITNSHVALNYLQDSFNIFEKIWLNVSENAREQTKQAVSRTQSIIKDGVSATKDATAKTSKAMKNTRTAVSKSMKNAASVKRHAAGKAKAGLKTRIKKA